MATHKSAKYPYQWPNGSWHSRPYRGTVGHAGQPSGGLPGSMGGPGYQPPADQSPTNTTPIQPPDPYYEQYKAQQGLNLNLSNADATYQRGNLTYDSGYNATNQRDYTNPYSRAALLEESYRRSKLGTTNSYANNGQLYSGAYKRQQGENDRNFSIQSNALQTATSRANHGIDVGQATNMIQYGNGDTSQALTALLKALGVNA